MTRAQPRSDPELDPPGPARRRSLGGRKVAVVSLAAGAGSRWTQGAGVVKALHPFCKLPAGGEHRSFLEVHAWPKAAASPKKSRRERCPSMSSYDQLSPRTNRHRRNYAHKRRATTTATPARSILSPRSRAIGLRAHSHWKPRSPLRLGGNAAEAA